MRILWFSWKDIKHPAAGGAELILHELAKRLITDGHSVTIVTARYPGSKQRDEIDGIDIIRVGTNRYLHSLFALVYYIRHLRNRYDVIIESVNTAPYMSCFFRGKSRAFLFYHQLAREIWFYETPFPLNWFGYLVLEPVATFILSRSRATVITVSESTKKDLMRFGFSAERIRIISEGIKNEPVESLALHRKQPVPTILSFGSMRAMKRTLDQIQAFELAKKRVKGLELIVAGDTTGPYGEKVMARIAASPYKDSITCLGRVSEEKKLQLMRQSHLFLATSVKEGWCLVVTEAASQGTPAVVYDIDGLRDSVKHGKTGIITADPVSLADGIVSLLENDSKYETIREEAWSWSKQFTFEHCYKDFTDVVDVA